jgi:predicted phage replisome organizer
MQERRLIMGEVQWVKLYIEMFDKPKINKIRRLPAGNDILLFWVMLLAQAGKCNAGGMIYITERVPFTKEDLADEFRFEISTIELALKAFVEFGMIDLYDDGLISVCNWEEYQNTDRLAELREYNRLAQRKSRAKKKLLQDVNDTSMTSQRCQGIEEEKDKDKEKDIHSFVHSTHEDEVWDSFDEESKLKYMHGTLGEGIVLMSEEQFSDLLDKLSLDEIHKYIEVIKECEKNGKRYKKKSHYQAILDMARKDRRVK